MIKIFTFMMDIAAEKRTTNRMLNSASITLMNADTALGNIYVYALHLLRIV
jgi:hypothetical protein